MARRISDIHGKKYRTDQFNHYSRRFNWPYCLQKRDGNKWVILNRDYKPLNVYAVLDREIKVGGGFASGWVDYKPFEIEIPKLDESNAKRLHFENYKGDTIFLYNDGCKPESKSVHRRNYIKKLELLTELLRHENNDLRTWREMFSGERYISIYECKPYEKFA